LRGSFRPDESICQLRALHRQCANVVEERSRAVLWMQKALDQMNVQVHRAVTDLTGQTGMAIVRAIVAGERDPCCLASLRDKRCRKSVEEIAEHLSGTWRAEHLFNLKMALRLYDELEAMIATYEAEVMKILETLQPPERRDQQPGAHPNPAKEKALGRRGEQEVRTAVWRVTGSDLTHIDGLSGGAARVILTEVGTDLLSFPSEKHFVSWLRLSPRVAISGGKPLSKKRNGTGATRVAGVLRMAALSLKNSRTALGAAFRRIARHKGAAVAVFAMARKLATLVYRMLRYGQDYVDEGLQAYEARFEQRRLCSLKQAARSLGYELLPVAVRG
jgi:transposase